MPFRLAIVVSSNPINLINAHSLHKNPLVNNAHWQSQSYLNGLLLAAVESKKAFIRV